MVIDKKSNKVDRSNLSTRTYKAIKNLILSKKIEDKINQDDISNLLFKKSWSYAVLPAVKLLLSELQGANSDSDIRKII